MELPTFYSSVKSPFPLKEREGGKLIVLWGTIWQISMEGVVGEWNEDGGAEMLPLKLPHLSFHGEIDLLR